jgi:hypothetical protein
MDTSFFINGILVPSHQYLNLSFYLFLQGLTERMQSLTHQVMEIEQMGMMLSESFNIRPAPPISFNILDVIINIGPQVYNQDISH